MKLHFALTCHPVFQTTGKVLPDWGFYQNEVATDKDHSLDSQIFNVEEHRYSQSEYSPEYHDELVLS